MKILYISGDQPDYLCDCVLHGLYYIFGENLTHTAKYNLMYKEYTNPEILGSIYGKGFTIWGNLPKYLNDNSDIIKKIESHYFNYIIYGSIHRNTDFLNIVEKYYNRNEFCFLDGEDHTYIMNRNNIYFKRELLNNQKDIYPISFAIPEEKICAIPLTIEKTRILAKLIPGDQYNRKYIYNNETDYYNGYRESYFGTTFKKAGWDCMRHYEILANYCLPYFPDLQNCPRLTMVNFPKEQILKANNLYTNFNIEKDLQQYYELLNEVFTYTKNHLITTVLAKYIIDVFLHNK